MSQNTRYGWCLGCKQIYTGEFLPLSDYVEKHGNKWHSVVVIERTAAEALIELGRRAEKEETKVKVARALGIEHLKLGELLDAAGLEIASKAQKSSISKENHCEHLGVIPLFDARATVVEMLPPAEVRRRWPRFEGTCPDCREEVVVYNGWGHFIAGDW